MLMPKKSKWRKQARGRMRGQAKGGDMVSFGEYGLKALEPCWVTSRQIEAMRVTISRAMSRTGKMWIRIFPDKPITKKPAETRMGKGKGPPEGWVAVVKPGRGDGRAFRGARRHGPRGIPPRRSQTAHQDQSRQTSLKL